MVLDYRKTTGFNWSYAIANATILKRFNVLTTDTKFVVDGRGVITYRGGYGAEDAATWQGVLSNLVQSG